jgi:hypothetical protein
MRVEKVLRVVDNAIRQGCEVEVETLGQTFTGRPRRPAGRHYFALRPPLGPSEVMVIASEVDGIWFVFPEAEMLRADS